MAIELVVLFVRDVARAALPQRARLVHALERELAVFLGAHLDGIGHVVGVARDQRAQARGREKLFVLVLEVQCDGGAAVFALGFARTERRLALALPERCLGRAALLG